MALSLRWISLLVLCPVLIQAQPPQTVTLDSAVTLFRQHSRQQTLAQQEQQRLRGEAIQYRAVRNPELSVSRENLTWGSLDYSETTYGISQPLALLGQPFLRFRAADRELEAAQYQFEYDQLQLIHQVKTLYVRYWNYSRQVEAYDNALQIIRLARESASEREIAGTYSGLQVQRFTIELLKYQEERDQVHLAMTDAGQQLATFIFPDEEYSGTLRVSESLPVQPVITELSVFETHALQFRPDIQALTERTASAALKLQVAKRNIMPDLSLTVGLKEQSDGAEGLVLGGSIALPLFNQNRGEITRARAAHRSTQTALALKKHRIKNEVSLVYQQVQLIRDRVQTVQESNIEASMLETAHSAYIEGRFSLLELLDATRAYLDGQTLRFQTIADYNKALYALDMVSAGGISNPQTNEEL